MKGNNNRPAGRVRLVMCAVMITEAIWYMNREWSPAHVMPPLDESTPLSHTHYWMGMLTTLMIMFNKICC